MPIPMPMPRLSFSRFPGLHDFPYFLIISGLLTCFELQQDKHYVAFTCSKSTIKTLEKDMKHVYS